MGGCVAEREGELQNEDVNLVRAYALRNFRSQFMEIQERTMNQEPRNTMEIVEKLLSTLSVLLICVVAVAQDAPPQNPTPKEATHSGDGAQVNQGTDQDCEHVKKDISALQD